MPQPPATVANGDGSVSDRHKVIPTGEFPFPVLAGGKESRQMVWVRNHANYMARRGWLDYVRAISVMVRGAIVNILIGLPFLILIALGVAALSVYGWGFRTAAGLMVLAFAWVIISPIGERLWAVVRIRNTIAVGTNSTVATRDRLERAFGALVILIFVAAIFESLSFFLDDFHFWTREQPRDGRALASIVTFSLAFLSAAGRVLPRLGGKAFKAAIAVVGVLGVLSPLVVVMFLADYLVFTGPTESAARGVMIAGIVLGLMIAFGIFVGIVAGALSRRNGGIALVVTLLVTIGLIGPANDGVDAVKTRQETLDTKLADLDVAFDSVPDLRTYKLDEDQNLAVDSQGRFIFAVSAKEFRQREREFRRLAEDTAGRPLPEVSSLVEFLDRSIEEANYLASEAIVPDAEGPGVLADLPSLERAAERLPGVHFLVGEGALDDVEVADIDALYEDLFKLDGRMFLLNEILDAHAVGPAELVQEVLTEFDEPIIAEDLGTARDPASEFPTLASDFPTLANKFPVEFSFVQDELSELGQLLREVRIEVNRVAIFSSQYPSLRLDGKDLRQEQLGGSAIFALMLAALLWAYVWIAVDPNRTSLHRLYRDRLAMAFLVGADTKDDVDVEEDLDLGELSRHEARSTAPYHLVNAAVNLPRSKNINLHDRKSDYFIFSKRFTGSEHVGYCRSDTMERAFPDMSLSTAMAVSGAAASPTMGRMTQPALVALMTILNVRLGIWIPNPGKLEEKIGYEPRPAKPPKPTLPPTPPGFSVDHVIASERLEVERRWKELTALGASGADRGWEHGLLGLACSGGGIRSATLNLGIAQALHQAGVFDHVDYLSTVSGGGFFGSSVSSAMRSRESTRSGIAGTIKVTKLEDELEVVIDPGGPKRRTPRRDAGGVDPGLEVHRFRRDATLCAEADPSSNRRIKPGTRLLDLGDPDVTVPGREAAVRQRRWWRRDRDLSPFGLQFRWRAKPSSLLREFAGRLDERSRWVNVSDGGHIENLGVYELLRRRCTFIIVGDGEFDPDHQFGGLTSVMRAARLELDTRIEIDLGPLRPNKRGYCAQHWAIGRIDYPGGGLGYLLYLKSSLTKDEDEDIVGYKVKHPEFPHQPTADQVFDEGQFEAYRRLGYRIAKGALRHHETFELHLAAGSDATRSVAFDDVQRWFASLDADTAKTT